MKGKKKWLTLVLVVVATVAVPLGILPSELVADLVAEATGA